MTMTDHDGPDWVTLEYKRGVEARRQHPCDGCPEGYILAGERYDRLVGLEDGVFQVIRMCQRFQGTLFNEHGICSREVDARAKVARWRAQQEARTQPLGPDELAF